MKLIQKLTLLTVSATALYISGPSSGWADEELFPASLLSDFLEWTPVLPDNRTFESVGHGGPIVRAYFNELSGPAYRDEAPLPFKEGSIIAKAVVPKSDVPSSKATRVYFMRKMARDYDPENGNWAYGFANLENGKYVFNKAQGKVDGCISCHESEKSLDYVGTVQIYRDALKDSAPRF